MYKIALFNLLAQTKYKLVFIVSTLRTSLLSLDVSSFNLSHPTIMSAGGIGLSELRSINGGRIS